MKNVAILLFNEVEVLDFAGPFEVFSIAEDESKNKLFNVFTVSEKEDSIIARNGLEIKAKYLMDDCPAINILIIPGGYGAEKIEIHNDSVLNWIIRKYDEVEILASVCTGVFLLAKSGIVTNQVVTTHWMDIRDLQSQYPNLKVVENKKYVESGKIITSGGISAGIEMSLHVVSNISGISVAEKTAKRMEYDWKEK